MARPRVERRSPQESQPAQYKVHLASSAAALGWPRHNDGRRTQAQSSLLQRAPRRKARSWCSKKELQRPAERLLAQAGISHQSWSSRRPQTETAGAQQWEKPVVSSRQRGINPQRKNAGGRKSEQYLYYSHPKPSSLQSTEGGAHQELVFTATNEHARIDHLSPPNPRLRELRHHHIDR